MLILKACAVCLTTDLKLNDLNSGQLRQEYNMASGLKTEQCIGMPQYLCIQCTAYVKRFAKFRQKCQLAYYILKKILDKNKEIKPSHLQALNANVLGLKPTLSFMDLKNCHEEEIKFQWDKLNRPGVTQGIKVPIAQSSTHKNVIFPVTSQNNINNELDTSTSKCIEEKSSSTKNIDRFYCKTDNFSQTDSFTEQNSPHYAEVVISSDDGDNELFEENEKVESDELKEESDKKKEETNEIEAENLKSIENAHGDGCNLEPEYAKMIPLSMLEAKAVSEVYKFCAKGKYQCEICKKCYTTADRLDVHLRMHNTHVSGPFQCELCHYYYRTNFLLKTHVTEKHMYKYLCRKCPEVNYERASAKQHYICAHLKTYKNKNGDWYEVRPDWLSKVGGKRVKGSVSSKPVRKVNKLPEDFLVYSPVRQEDQYRIINERQRSRNYTTSPFKCEFCFKGYRNIDTYYRHMKRHDPASGSFECDMCKKRFNKIIQIYKHITTNHIFKYTCQHCEYVCFSKNLAHQHYKFHKDVIYSCPHCDKKFKKPTTRLSHIRILHPSTFICNLCGNSFVSESGLYFHKMRAHSKEEIESSSFTNAEAETKAEMISDPLYCADCRVRFVSQDAFETHLVNSNKHAGTDISTMARLRKKKMLASTSKTSKIKSEHSGPGRGRKRIYGAPSDVHNVGLSTASTCELCFKYLPTEKSARNHYRAVHPGESLPKRFMCDVCGHTTHLYSNLVIHIRRHTKEKPFGCPHCDRTFSMQCNRNRHLLVHSGKKPFHCELCSRRFSQSGQLKLHIKVVHEKVPHAPSNKKNRKRSSKQENASLKAAGLSEVSNQEDPFHSADYLAAFINHSNE